MNIKNAILQLPKTKKLSFKEFLIIGSVWKTKHEIISKNNNPFIIPAKSIGIITEFQESELGWKTVTISFNEELTEEQLKQNIDSSIINLTFEPDSFIDKFERCVFVLEDK